MDGYDNHTETVSIASEPDGVIAFNTSNNDNANNMTNLIVNLICRICKYVLQRVFNNTSYKSAWYRAFTILKLEILDDDTNMAIEYTYQ